MAAALADFWPQALAGLFVTIGAGGFAAGVRGLVTAGRLANRVEHLEASEVEHGKKLDALAKATAANGAKLDMILERLG